MCAKRLKASLLLFLNLNILFAATVLPPPPCHFPSLLKHSDMELMRFLAEEHSAKDMARKAMQYLQKLPVPVAEKVALWKRFAQIIRTNRLGLNDEPWISEDLGEFHGWHFFKGAILNVLAISPQGVLYKTQLHFLGNVRSPDWKPQWNHFEEILE